MDEGGRAANAAFSYELIFGRRGQTRARMSCKHNERQLSLADQHDRFKFVLLVKV